MKKFLHACLYEKADYDLVEEVQSITGGSGKKHLQRLFDSGLHPRGIKELAARREVRLVYAMHRLLALDYGPDAIEQRLSALQALRDETIDGNPSSLRLNTARVLLQVMKLLIRSSNTPERQLQLAHELRMALIGQPRFIRRQLRRYHLLEMPENWNQTTFDDHVHDANTKGRKTPTHLIMDAWIKGIRQLQVIYYNEVPPAAARELLKAAEIMNIEVRIGLEFTIVGRGRLVKMIWTPRGFLSADNFLTFLEKPEVQEFFNSFAEVNDWKKKQVLAKFNLFNSQFRLELNQRFKVELPEQPESDFLHSIGNRQPSRLHLAEFICTAYTQLLEARIAAATDSDLIAEYRHQLTELTPESLHDRYLADDEMALPADLDTLPVAMRLSQSELADLLYHLPCGCRLCLNLTGLPLEDILEIIYDCGGKITHLETFNLKDYKTGKSSDMMSVNTLRQAINDGNVIRLKRTIREYIERLSQTPGPDNDARIAKLHLILRNIDRLIGFYAQNPLGTRLGSDSTGRYRRLNGMGLAVIESLPWREQRRIVTGKDANREVLPIDASVTRCAAYFPWHSRLPLANWLTGWCKRLNYPFGLGLNKTETWKINDSAARIGGDRPGNIAALGGYWDEPNQEGISLFHPKTMVDYWNCLNSHLKIAIKIILGFIPAFLTFYYTKDWWLLIYFGAFIWLGITCVRNIIQAVLGGGGLRRSDLLKWNDFISWQRIADSLLYTGFSVPLLDLCVKTLLLQKGFNLTADQNPLLVYSVMALVNGSYICSHNLFRGLPKTAATGNLFRTVLSIPLAILLSAALTAILGGAGVANVANIIQQWAAIISKLASDCVAGLIEGYADRMKNIRLRLNDYRIKLQQLFADYSRLEMLFPEADVLEMLKSPKSLLKAIPSEEDVLERKLIINAVDLLYFWRYQPQAPNALKICIRDMTSDERLILLRSQTVLKREKEISQMFIDGLVGKRFSAALAFYLDNNLRYLKAMEHLLETQPEE